MNINFTLIIIFLVLIIYIMTLLRKISMRKRYIKTLDQSHKDLYIKYSRQVEFVYENFVFPNTMMVNMMCFFNTILYLQPSRISETD